MEDRLFLYEMGDGGHLKARREIDLRSLPPADDKPMFRLSDIEAFARLPSGEVILYGSHSRKKACQHSGKRRIFAHVTLENGKIGVGSVAPVKAKKHKCTTLFGNERDDLEPVMRRVCVVVERTEKKADKAADRQSESDCQADPAFNLEGAIAIQSANGTPRVWVGLRAPLVDNKAVLLRQEPDLKAFRFDAVAFVDLNGHGIRELTFAAGKVWGIAGPASDPDAGDDVPHRLWHVDANVLRHGANIEPTFADRDLPTFAEGLDILEPHAFILMDGEDPGSADPMTCRNESKYLVRRVF